MTVTIEVQADDEPAALDWVRRALLDPYGSVCAGFPVVEVHELRDVTPDE